MIPVVDGLDCRPLADTLREFGLHSAAFLVDAGVRTPDAVGAIRQDLSAADRSEQESAYRALDGLVDCYARRDSTRVLRAIAAWDIRGCATCASHIAIVDAHSLSCADCADTEASS